MVDALIIGSRCLFAIAHPDMIYVPVLYQPSQLSTFFSINISTKQSSMLSCTISIILEAAITIIIIMKSI